MKIGVISDTHGLLRPEVLAALEGCERIIHGGDVGNVETLERLRTLAPIVAVARGNVDRGAWAEQLPATETVVWQGATIHVVHDRADFDGGSLRTRPDVVVSGHSHRASLALVNRTLFLNPGSVGPRRFRLPVTMAWLYLANNRPPRAEFFTFTS